MIIDGRLFSGGDSMGAELGHVPIIANENRAHAVFSLLGYASVTALIRQTNEAMAKILGLRCMHMRQNMAGIGENIV